MEKESKVKAWVEKTAAAYNLTEQEFSECIEGRRHGTQGLQWPEWLSFGSEYADSVQVGWLFYDEILDRNWESDSSPVDRYVVLK